MTAESSNRLADTTESQNMSTRKTRLNTESPTPNSGSDSAPSTPSATRKRLVRKINEVGKLDDKDDKTSSPSRTSRPRINRNSLMESRKSPVVAKVRRKVQSASGACDTEPATPDVPKKRTVCRRRNSTGRIEVERKQSERLSKKLRSGKSHKTLMSSPKPEKTKVVRKRLRLKDKTDEINLKKIGKRKSDKIETASDSELLLPVRRRSDSVSKCSDITDTSSYMDVPLVMLKDADDTFSSVATTAATLECQQEDTSNDIPIKEMIKRELLFDEALKREAATKLAADTKPIVSAAVVVVPPTDDCIKTEGDVKNIKIEITNDDDKKTNLDVAIQQPVSLLPPPTVSEDLETEKKEIKEQQLLIDVIAPILNDSGIGGDTDANTTATTPAVTITTPVLAPSPATAINPVAVMAAATAAATGIADVVKTKAIRKKRIVEPVKRKRVVKKPPVPDEKVLIKKKTIRKRNTTAVTKAKEKTQANAKLKENIKQRQPLIQTAAGTIAIPLRVQSVVKAAAAPPPVHVPLPNIIPVKKEVVTDASLPATKSPSPVLISVGVSEISVKQFYGQPDFLENNLGIEKDPKLGEIVQEKTKLVVTEPPTVALPPALNVKVPSPITLTNLQSETAAAIAMDVCSFTSSTTPSKANSPETDHDSSQEIAPEDHLRIEDSDTPGNSSEGVPTPKKERLTVATTTVETIQTHDRTIIEITTNGVQHNRTFGGMAAATSAQPISVADSIKCVTVTERHERPKPSATANITGTLDKPLSMEVELIPILPVTAVRPAQNVSTISVEPIESAAPAPIVPPPIVLPPLAVSPVRTADIRMTEPDNKENIIINKAKDIVVTEEQQQHKIAVTSKPVQPVAVSMTTTTMIGIIKDVKNELPIELKKETVTEEMVAEVTPIVINESPELLKEKESLLLTLGLLPHQAADAAKIQHKHKREEAHKSKSKTSEYTGSLKTIIKLPRPTVNSGGAALAAAIVAAAPSAAATTTAAATGINATASVANNASDKKKPVRESLKMTLHKARGKLPTDREQATNSDGTDTYYTIQNEVSFCFSSIPSPCFESKSDFWVLFFFLEL